MERSKEKRPLGKSGHTLMYNIKRDRTKMTSENVDRIHIAQNRDKCRAPMSRVKNICVPKTREIS